MACNLLDSEAVPPEEVEARVTLPMQPGMRALNVALACAIAPGEAVRQLRGAIA